MYWTMWVIQKYKSSDDIPKPVLVSFFLWPIPEKLAASFNAILCCLNHRKRSPGSLSRRADLAAIVLMNISWGGGNIQYYFYAILVQNIDVRFLGQSTQIILPLNNWCYLVYTTSHSANDIFIKKSHTKLCTSDYCYRNRWTDVW